MVKGNHQFGFKVATNFVGVLLTGSPAPFLIREREDCVFGVMIRYVSTLICYVPRLPIWATY